MKIVDFIRILYILIYGITPYINYLFAHKNSEGIMTPKKILDMVVEKVRVKHYSIRTEQAYVYWAKKFILFHNKKHPRIMGGKEINKFLSHLAVEKNVAASTQNQALNAIIFLYKEVLNIDISNFSNFQGGNTASTSYI